MWLPFGSWCYDTLLFFIFFFFNYYIYNIWGPYIGDAAIALKFVVSPHVPRDPNIVKTFGGTLHQTLHYSSPLWPSSAETKIHEQLPLTTSRTPKNSQWSTIFMRDKQIIKQGLRPSREFFPRKGLLHIFKQNIKIYIAIKWHEQRPVHSTASSKTEGNAQCTELGSLQSQQTSQIVYRPWEVADKIQPEAGRWNLLSLVEVNREAIGKGQNRDIHYHKTEQIVFHPSEGHRMVKAWFW